MPNGFKKRVDNNPQLKGRLTNGFADVVADDLSADACDAKNIDRGLMARRQTEAALAGAGFSRTIRSEMLSELIGSAARDASQPSAPRDAGIDEAALQRLIDILRL